MLLKQYYVESRIEFFNSVKNLEIFLNLLRWITALNLLIATKWKSPFLVTKKGRQFFIVILIAVPNEVQTNE